VTRLAIAFFPLIALSAATIPMDSRRGDKLFETAGCIQCHRLKGAGGMTASDLGRVLDRGYTPDDLASTMWNHAPTMWKTINEKAFKVGDVDRQAAADLFASFYSARYFEMPGDAGRGKRLFAAKSCASCHGVNSSLRTDAKPVSQWQSLADPIALVGAMWNHSPAMWSEISTKKLAWPALTSQELADLLVYLRNISPEIRNTPPMLQITAGENGAKLFESKGCIVCHASRAKGTLTLTGVAAAMWNHAPLLHREPPRLDTSEMREVLSYSWAKPFFESSGDAAKGRRLFAGKHCADCHTGAGPGPVLSDKAGTWNGITMVSALWHHGPAMLAEMNRRKIGWPAFRSGEMTDLIAFINQRAAKP
jgi:mono/diheme cytochrome c family protein